MYQSPANPQLVRPRPHRTRVHAMLWAFGLLLTAPPALAISSRTLIAPTGAATLNSFGFSVSSAGDVNGDGYGDVIVGAYGYSTYTGRAYVYYGGPGADNVPDLILTGAAVGDNFGTSVSSAGDVNGDGYGDLIVGAPNYNSITGRAYVYYGGPGADNVADLTLTGEAAGDYFGYSVSSAGDVNGDGYGDVIVGASGYSAGTGRAYVYYGGPGADNVADLTLPGVASSSFGWAVFSAGDVNGDGFGDVIVGAYSYSNGTGRAYVYYGGPGADNVADLTLTGGASGDYFGWSVSSAGDVNGDGFGDVTVGAPDYSATTGRAYVYYGGPGPDNVADLTLTGGAPSDYFGTSVSSAGDVNGDGYGDVIVGASGNNTNIGHAYAYYGGPGADNVADLIWTRGAPGDFFGISVSSAGDVNGDGYGDVIVGERGYGGVTGRAYVTLIYPYQVLSPNGGEQWVAGLPGKVRWLGHDAADIELSADAGATWTTLAGGVGGAEENEFVVAAPATPTKFARVRVSYSGQVAKHSTSDLSDADFHIVLPVTPPSAAARLQLEPTGGAAANYFGVSVSSAGDMNGDGYGDMIVGAPGYNSSTGRAYVYYGGPGADNVADLTLTSAAAGDNFGVSVSSAGDVNGDGYGDVIVGAYGYSGNTGRAYVYYGGPGADNVADLTLTGGASSDYFGVSVSSAGDVNGDGYGDVIVGAYGYSSGTGRAYVYYGGSGADNVADLTLTGAASGDNFGASVSSAGDVNGDGHVDLIVGAYLNDANGADAGRAYVYYGGPGADNVADLTLTGEAANNYFGLSVSPAGDVNGDGYGEVIVGADGYATNTGRAYVYYGGPGADTVADLTLTGDATNNDFGRSVSSVGDVNGDGYGDVIVGAFGYGSTGRTYLYYGGPGADNVADLTLTGAPGDALGVSVSSAGDVNGDGFGDVIVGAYGYSSFTGRARVYDMNRYHLLSPIGGETWNVGAVKAISWLGTEPADVWLSSDGGNTYQLQLSRVGGADANSVPLRVPHLPSKFARVRVTPSDASLKGMDQSDSSFTIQTSVALLALLAAPAPQGASGALVTWRTDPGLEDLAGYRLERASGSDWSTVVALTREMSYADPTAGPATRYRLFAVNGLGEELLLGETSFRPAAPLAAWPLPYRGGNLSIAFATAGGLGGGPGSAVVSVYDAAGRLVRNVARGQYPAGYRSVIWDGRDDRGMKVAAGVYFLKAATGGDENTMKLVLVR